MRSLWSLLLILLLLPASAVAQDDTVAAQQLFLTHLQGNIQDIHDVIIRFHRVAPLLRGQVVLRLEWSEGRLTHGEVVTDETGDEDLGLALLEAIGKWEIEGLVGPAELTVPFATHIVGREDDRFPQSALLTGRVTDDAGRPIAGAELDLQPENGGILRATTNREGIFILTLMPPGIYRLRCGAEGYQWLQQRVPRLGEGEHRLLDLELAPVGDEPGR